MAKKKSDTKSNKNGAMLGFEAKLYQAADKLRNNMDAAEYKHVVLGLIFLKYISDSFEEKYHLLLEEFANPQSEFYIKEEMNRFVYAEDRDEYLAENIFYVPQEARWSHLQANAKQIEIGTLIDNAMLAIEQENPRLKGVLPKNYARPGLDKQRLGELVDLIGTIGLGEEENRSKDILGRVYEYFLSQFASAEGKRGGQFYTPRCVVQLLVEMLAPYQGRIYDPCCGSGGMFVQSEEFVEAHGGQRDDISIYGQESNPTTRQLALMNLAIRGIEANLGQEHADSFHDDMHPDLKVDYILANPPFNSSDWGGDRLREDRRWVYGTPPTGNANFAWVQHFIYHLAPNGIAGFVLANGSMSTNTATEGEIRKKIIEADLVDCMVALPGQLFYSTSIPVCLWFITKSKENHRYRKRAGETLFIDARRLGKMIDRVHRELTNGEMKRIAETYHAWRGDEGAGEYVDVPGFCKSTTLAEVQEHSNVLTPGRYVGAEVQEEDTEPFEETMAHLTQKLTEQMAEARRLDDAIAKNLQMLGFGDEQSRFLWFDKQPVPGTGFGSLDESLWKPLLSAEGAAAPELALEKMGLLTNDENDTTRATVAGILLCTRSPEEWIPNACISATCYRGVDRASGQIDAQTINGPLNLQIADAVAFAVRNMRVGAYKNPARTDLPQYSEKALFEAIVNAVVHRDYAIRGSRIRLSMFADRVEINSPGGLPNNLTIDSMDVRQSTRNEALASMLGRISVESIRGSGDRQFFMERRGDGVPTILRETRDLSGQNPEYQLIDNSDLILTIPAADTNFTPATVGIVVHHRRKPLPEVEVLVLFPNQTWKRVITDENGDAQIDLHTTHVPMTVFASAPGFKAHLERDWVPANKGLALEMQSLQDGGSVIFPEGTGNIPGLSGRLNPKRDTRDRTYLYASNIAINEGQQQPVHFILGEDMRLTDADGRELLVRIVAIVGKSALLEYRPYTEGDKK